MIKTTSVGSVLALSLVVPSLAQGAVVDNFNYNTNSALGGQGSSTTGSGVQFTSGWIFNGGSGSATVFNSGIGSAAGQTSSAPFVQGAGTFDVGRGVTATSGETTYFSILLAIGDDNDDDITTNSFGGVSLYSGSTERFFFGQRFGSDVWGVESSGFGNSNSDDTISEFTLTFLVAKLDQVGNTFTLWVNPDLSETEATNTADAAVTYSAISEDFNNIRLRGGNDDHLYQYDNLAISRSSPFAAPVPEPLTVLGGSALLGMLALRRRG